MGDKLIEGGSKDNEGTDWEARYREKNSPWDHGVPAPSVSEAIKFFGKGKRILVPGCGFGHDAIALASAGNDVEGWDIAPTALERARILGRGKTVSFHQKNVLNGSHEGNQFDAIFEHTFLCAIGPDHWKQAVEQFANLLRPGGLFFAILFTNLNEDSPPPWGIGTERARELFDPYFEVLEIREPKCSFERRVGEETLWQLRLK
tara:strand:+ start:11321 stop:11932 length:612 start_codon:yes stop_codon:yes gene_type:complete